MINSHPPFELLLDYASGSLPEPVALAIACHASLCSECARELEAMDAAGGALLDGIDVEAVSPNAFDALLARLDEPEPPQVPAPVMDQETQSVIPGPLRAYLGTNLSNLPWRKVNRAIDEVRLATSRRGFKTALMRLKPGSIMPRHTHRGSELTVVLAGGYTDSGRQFLRGDIDIKDPSHEHRPVVDDDGECLCLVVLDAPLKLTGAIGRFVNPFLRV